MTRCLPCLRGNRKLEAFRLLQFTLVQPIEERTVPCDDCQAERIPLRPGCDSTTHTALGLREAESRTPAASPRTS
jgi:hypothetical protein